MPPVTSCWCAGSIDLMSNDLAQMSVLLLALLELLALHAAA
jgi:hypothetical protein